MKLLMRYASIPVLALGLLARPASAQLNSLPVFHSPKGGAGFTLAASYGMGVNDDSDKNTTWAARASIGIQELTIGGGIATVNPKVSTGNREQEIQWMANLAYRVFGGALVPVAVSIQGGVGHLSHQVAGAAAGEVTEWRFPIGVGVALNIPTPGFSFEPWIAPRADILRSEEEIGTILGKKTRGGYGVSAGVSLGFAMGLGLHTAVDWSSLPETRLGFVQFPETKPVTFGIGVHYSFRLPGVPLVPGV
jgi:hypothetical protein